MVSNAWHLGPLTILSLSGKDRNKILQNLTTQDIKSIEVGQCRESFITDVKGRTIGHGTVAMLEDTTWFVTVPNQAARLLPHIDRYIFREDAKIIDCSDRYDGFVLQTLPGEDSHSDPSAASPSNITLNTIKQHVAPNYIELSAGWTGPLTSIAIVPQEQRSTFDSLNRVIDTSHPSYPEWQRLRIRAFWPWFGIDLSDANLPQEADRIATSISFKKGCYLGQETVARLDALGQVQKKLVTLEIEGTDPLALPAAARADDKDVGNITSCALEASKSSLVALGMIRRSHFAVGTTLTIDGRRATVVENYQCD